MSSTTPAFPYTGIPSTEVTREPGHTGMAEHGSDITKQLLQGVNDRVERMTDEADPVLRHAESRVVDAGARLGWQARQVRDAGMDAADSTREAIRAHPLTAVFMGIALGALVARIARG